MRLTHYIYMRIFLYNATEQHAEEKSMQMKRYYVSKERKEEKKNALIAYAFKEKYGEAYNLLHKETQWPDMESMGYEIESSFPKTYEELREETSVEYQEWLYDAEGHNAFDEE